MSQPSKSDATAIQKVDRKRQVLSLLRQGVDVRTIAERLDLGEEYVKSLARDEMEFLTLQVQELQEHFVALTYTRSELVMSRIMPDFEMEPPVKPDTVDEKELEKWREEARYYRRMIGESAKNYALITRVQKEILQLRGADDKKPGSVNIENMAVSNITLTSNNDLYRDALDSIHMDLHGETYPEKQIRLLQELEVVQLPEDDRLSKIEHAIENLNIGTDTDEGRPEDG